MMLKCMVERRGTLILSHRMYREHDGCRGIYHDGGRGRLRRGEGRGGLLREDFLRGKRILKNERGRGEGVIERLIWGLTRYGSGIMCLR